MLACLHYAESAHVHWRVTMPSPWTAVSEFELTYLRFNYIYGVSKYLLQDVLSYQLVVHVVGKNSVCTLDGEV